MLRSRLRYYLAIPLFGTTLLYREVHNRSIGYRVANITEIIDGVNVKIRYIGEYSGHSRQHGVVRSNEEVLGRRICTHMFFSPRISGFFLYHKPAVFLEGGETVARRPISRGIGILIASGITGVAPLRNAVVRLLHAIGDEVIVLIHGDGYKRPILSTDANADGLPSATLGSHLGAQVSVSSEVHCSDCHTSHAGVLYRLHHLHVRRWTFPIFLAARKVLRIENQIGIVVLVVVTQILAFVQVLVVIETVRGKEIFIHIRVGRKTRKMRDVFQRKAEPRRKVGVNREANLFAGARNKLPIVSIACSRHLHNRVHIGRGRYTIAVKSVVQGVLFRVGTVITQFGPGYDFGWHDAARRLGKEAPIHAISCFATVNVDALVFASKYTCAAAPGAFCFFKAVGNRYAARRPRN